MEERPNKRKLIKAPTDLDYAALNSGDMRTAYKNIVCIMLKKLGERAVKSDDLKMQDAQLMKTLMDSIKFIEEKEAKVITVEAELANLSSEELLVNLQKLSELEKKIK